MDEVFCEGYTGGKRDKTIDGFYFRCDLKKTAAIAPNTEREEQERIQIYEEAKRKAKIRYADFIDKEEQLRMIAEIELMLTDPKNHFSRHMLYVEMNSLTDKFLDK